MCQVSLAEPSALSRWRDRNTASAGVSRDVPGSAACAASTERDLPPSSTPSTAAVLSPFVSLSSTASPFNNRAVILPPGAQRLRRSSLFLKMALA